MGSPAAIRHHTEPHIWLPYFGEKKVQQKVFLNGPALYPTLLMARPLREELFLRLPLVGDIITQNRQILVL